MKKITILVLVLLGILSTIPQQLYGQSYCNPINISYRFCLDNPSRREAADPTIVLFKDKYFLFASKSGGYWYSDDLLTWNFVTTADLPLEDYAPAAVVIKDSLYFLSSGNYKVYRTGDAISGKWEVFTNAFQSMATDPDLFADTDGRVYYYYGCSNVTPIYAIELNPNNKFKFIGKAVTCLNSDTTHHGWERPGDYNTNKNRPWIEGSWMTKYNGKYYLQYATPGTEFKAYADGVYVSDNPLGPFTYASNNPFSSKPEGFINGAGHSSTFQDKYGNWWHISTMTISVKHMFERRLGLFPAGFDSAENLYVCSNFGDYPIRIPNKKVDSVNELSCGWMLLSYKKTAEASSTNDTFPLNLAFDENIRTYWSAKTGDSGEWLSIDLNKASTIHAIQINFAENNTTLLGRTNVLAQRFLVEYSDDKSTWKTLIDKTTNDDDLTHQYFELDSAIKARYVKVTNYRVPSGTFAISDFRIFGIDSTTPAPTKVSSFDMVRTDRDSRSVKIFWNKQANATGYNIKFGFENDKLYRSYMVYGDTSVTIRSLNANQPYWFEVDAFGEGGMTIGDTIEALITHDTTTNIERYSENDKIRIAYPNPATSYITICKPQSKSPVKLYIYNVLGEKIQSHLLTKSETKLSVASMEKGVYFFVASANDYREITKVLIK